MHDQTETYPLTKIGDKTMDTKQNKTDNRVIIGDNPLMAYLRAILVILRVWLEAGANGMFGVVVRARGEKTSFAVAWDSSDEESSL